LDANGNWNAFGARTAAQYVKGTIVSGDFLKVGLEPKAPCSVLA
jgi:hypothetical protein